MLRQQVTTTRQLSFACQPSTESLAAARPELHRVIEQRHAVVKQPGMVSIAIAKLVRFRVFDRSLIGVRGGCRDCTTTCKMRLRYCYNRKKLLDTAITPKSIRPLDVHIYGETASQTVERVKEAVRKLDERLGRLDRVIRVAQPHVSGRVTLEDRYGESKDGVRYRAPQMKSWTRASSGKWFSSHVPHSHLAKRNLRTGLFRHNWRLVAGVLAEMQMLLEQRRRLIDLLQEFSRQFVLIERALNQRLVDSEARTIELGERFDSVPVGDLLTSPEFSLATDYSA